MYKVKRMDIHYLPLSITISVTTIIIIIMTNWGMHLIRKKEIDQFVQHCQGVNYDIPVFYINYVILCVSKLSLLSYQVLTCKELITFLLLFAGMKSYN